MIVCFSRLSVLCYETEHMNATIGQHAIEGSEYYLYPCRDISHFSSIFEERGGSVVECQTPEREVGSSKPTSAVLCP